MAELTVQQSDADRSEATRTEILQVLQYGAKVGSTFVVDKIFPTPPNPAAIQNLMSMLEAISIAIVRLSQNGTAVFPVGLPTYSLALANVPPAASYPACVIYVSDGAVGAPVLAFSDGSNWLRSDSLGPISLV
jgi:hypothetical protein